MSEELVVLENLNAVQLYTAGGTDKILQDIRDEVLSVVPDVSTAKGRKEISNRSGKVSKSKVILLKLGNALKDDLKAQLKPITLETTKVTNTLDALRKEVREPLTIWEDAETQRVISLKERLTDFDFSLDRYLGWNIQQIQFDLDVAKNTDLGDNWQEFLAEAQKAKPVFIEKLTAYLAELVEKKKQADELIKLQEAEAERAQKERDEAIRKEAAAKAEAEKVAALAREEATKKQAAQDAKDAEAREKQGIEDATARVKAAEAKAAEDQKKAEAKAEIDKKSALDAAVEAERQRVANEKEAEEKAAAKKSANRKHQGAINRAALASFAEIGIDETTAKKIITAIFEKKIANITINY